MDIQIVIADNRRLYVEAAATRTELKLTKLQRCVYCLLLERDAIGTGEERWEHSARLCALYDFFNQSIGTKPRYAYECVVNLMPPIEPDGKRKNQALRELISKANRKIRECVPDYADELAIKYKEGQYYIDVPKPQVKYETTSTAFSSLRKGCQIR